MFQNVVEYAKTLPNVVYAENNLYTCSNDAQNRIKEKITEHSLNRVVVASCTPRTHEPLFRNTLAEAGLNPYLFEMANIRDQCSWVHMHEPEKATQKSKDLLRMAVAKSRLLQPLQRQRIKIQKSALVIGGGLSGMTAALTLARQGSDVYLVEKENELGGNLRHIHYLLNGENPQEELARLRGEIQQNSRIHLFTGAVIENIEGSIGNFKTRISAHGVTTEVAHGVVIVATGAKQYQPKEYLYRTGRSGHHAARSRSTPRFRERLPGWGGESARKNRCHDPVCGITRCRPSLLFSRVLRRRHQERPAH